MDASLMGIQLCVYMFSSSNNAIDSFQMPKYIDTCET